MTFSVDEWRQIRLRKIIWSAGGALWCNKKRLISGQAEDPFFIFPCRCAVCSLIRWFVFCSPHILHLRISIPLFLSVFFSLFFVWLCVFSWHRFFSFRIWIVPFCCSCLLLCCHATLVRFVCCYCCCCCCCCCFCCCCWVLLLKLQLLLPFSFS